MVVEKLEKAQGKRMLSILLAVVMVLSTASVCLVSAAAKRESNLVSAQGEEEAFEESSFYSQGSTNKTEPYATEHEHIWFSANCVRPATCSVCGLTTGAALGHSFDTDGYCTRCGQDSHGNVKPSFTGTTDPLDTTTSKPYGESTTDVEEDGFIWSPIYLDGDYYKEVRITGYRGEVPETLVIPEKIGDADVTYADLTDRVFYSSEVKEIRIPRTVKNIYLITTRYYSAYGRNYSDPEHYFPSLQSFTVDPDNSYYFSRDGVLFETQSWDSAVAIKAYPPAKEGDTYIVPSDVGIISAGAFLCATKLKTIVLPQGLERIQFHAFLDCIRLTNCRIPKSVQSVSGQCFEGCLALSAVEVDAANPDFYSADGVLYSRRDSGLLCYPCGKQEKLFTVPDGIKNIEYGAFTDCASLESITFSDSVETVFSAFENCVNLSDIHLSQSITYLNDDAFHGTAFYTDARNWSDGVLYCDEWCLAFNEDLPAELTLREGTGRISNSAFSGRTQLQKIILPSSLRVIMSDAFRDCTGLQTVTFADGLESIGYDAFNGCSSLQSVQLPDSVQYVEEGAFSGCTVLRSASLSAAQTEIAARLFYNCRALEQVTIPAGVTLIGYSAFSGCSSLHSIRIPEGVTEIRAWAFEQCTALTSVDLPDSLQRLGDAAFDGCSALSAFRFPEKLAEIGVDAVQNTAFAKDPKNYSDGVLYYGNFILGIDRERIASDLKIREGTVSACGSAFYNCDNLESVTIPGSMQVLPSGLFEYCSSLKTVHIEEGVKEIGYSVFYCCPKLENVTLPGSLTRIKSDAFGDTGLKEIIIPSGVTSLGFFAFNGSQLKKITLPNTLTYIGRWCFENTPLYEDRSNWKDGVLYIGNHLIRADAETLTGVYSIRDKTYSIACEAFSRCKELTEVKIPNTVRGIGEYAFYGCSGLTALQIPNSVKEIYHGAFEACTGLESIALSDRITSCHSLLKGCSGLKKVEIPTAVTTIAYASFAGCTALEEITLPRALQMIDGAAFDECSNLQKVYYKGNAVEWNAVEIEREMTAYNHYEKYGNNDNILTAQKIYPSSVQQGGVTVDYFDEDLPNAQLVVMRQEPKADDATTFQINSGESIMKYQIHFVDTKTQQIAQPKGHTVTVRIPVDRKMAEDYPPSQFAYYVYHAKNDDYLDNESFSTNGKGISKVVRIEGNVQDGYNLVFDVSSFSPFLVCVERSAPTVSIHNNPGTVTLRYGETIVLTADAENLPDGAKLVWEADSDRVVLKPSADGTTCEVTSKKNGTVTVTVKVVDADGNPIEVDDKAISDNETIRSKATFLYKLIAFFKRLFGIVVYTTQAVSTSREGNA